MCHCLSCKRCREASGFLNACEEVIFPGHSRPRLNKCGLRREALDLTSTRQKALDFGSSLSHRLCPLTGCVAIPSWRVNPFWCVAPPDCKVCSVSMQYTSLELSPPEATY